VVFSLEMELFFNAFNPSIAVPGYIPSIIIILNNTGCETIVSQTILVGTGSYNFVNYNLGTIAP